MMSVTRYIGKMTKMVIYTLQARIKKDGMSNNWLKTKHNIL